jgi:branched-chain amino acid transport system substrate-binding protein
MSKFNKKVVATTAAAILAMGTLAGCGTNNAGGGSSNQSGGSDSGTIKIGLDFELTGAEASFGNSAYQGAQLAVDELNSNGGVLGKKIELVKADNASKADEATRVAQKLIDKDKVDAIIGATISTDTLAIVPIVQQNKIPLISSSATNPKVTVNPDTGKVNDWVFRACFIDPFQGTVMANFSSNTLHAKTAVVLVDNSSDYSKGLAKFFQDSFQKNGGKILSVESYQANDPDFKAILTKVKNENPDVVYVPGYYNDVGKIVKQGREAGITVPFEGGDGWDSPELVKIAGAENLNNTFISNHYAADDTDPVVQKFVKDFQSKYGNAPDAMAVLGYDALNLLANAFKQAGSTDHTKVRDALAATKDFQAVTGKISFNENHDPVKSAVILEYKDGKQVFKTKVNP